MKKLFGIFYSTMYYFNFNKIYTKINN